MSESRASIVVSLGKAKKRQIDLLKDGEGPLVAGVLTAVEQVRAQLGAEADSKELVPVVLVYRRKRKRRGFLG